METISNEALAAARAKLDAAESRRENILLFHIANGVNIENRTVQIEEGVVIAPGATILAGTILRGKTVIGAGCVIGPNTLIDVWHRRMNSSSRCRISTTPTLSRAARMFPAVRSSACPLPGFS